MGLLITFLLGLFFVLGSLIVKFFKNTKLIENLSISIALGTMASLVVFDLIPEMLEHMKDVSIIISIVLIICGIGILKILDLFIPEHDHEHGFHHNCSEKNLIHIGIVSLIAIILHNIIEGMAVYSLSIDSPKTALLVALGVGLHNIPMGMIITSTMQHEPKKYRIITLLLATLSTFFGGLLMFFVSSMINDFIIGALICLTLGMILYIVLFELIPHVLHSDNKKVSILGIICGIIIILISSLFE
jgi:ZIP family zinc transporter